MLQDLQMNTEAHWANGYSKWKTHYLIGWEDEYLKPIEALCNITAIPDVLHNMVHDSFGLFLSQPTEFRKFKYSAVDSNNFTRIKFNED